MRKINVPFNVASVAGSPSRMNKPHIAQAPPFTGSRTLDYARRQA
jgi:hypothetical protein